MILKDSNGQALWNGVNILGDGDSAAPPPPPPPPPALTVVYQFNAGSATAVGNYVAGDNTGFQSGGFSYNYGAGVVTDVSAANSASPAVYPTVYYGSSITIAIPLSAGTGMTSGSLYTVRLHFSEGSASPTVGQRVANYSLNGTVVLTNFDIYAAAGQVIEKSVVREFAVNASASGITLTSTASAGSTRISGIEIYR